MRDTNTNYVFMVMMPFSCHEKDCWRDEYFHAGRIFADRDTAEAEATRIPGSFVVAKYVYGGEELP